MKKTYIVFSFILYSCGGGGGSGAESIEIQNNPPSINNSTFTYQAMENQTEAFFVSASDPENDAIFMKLMGVQMEIFFQSIQMDRFLFICA